MKLEFSQYTFEKNSQIPTLMTFDPEGAVLFHVDRETDRQTDIHGEANSRFANAPKNWQDTTVSEDSEAAVHHILRKHSHLLALCLV
jgi:hypothetical protein